MTELMKKYIRGAAVVTAVLAPLAMLVEVFMDLMQPRLLESIIDVGIANQDLNYVYQTGAKMVIMAVIGFLGGSGCSALAAIASTEMATELRQGLFDRIQEFSFKEIDHLKTSSLITRLTNDVTQVQNMLTMVLRGAVRSPLLCIGGMIMAFLASPRLALIFVTAVPVILIATILILRKAFPMFSRVQSLVDRVNMFMRESILGVRIMKSLTLEEDRIRKFQEVNLELMEESRRAQNVNMLLWPIVTLVMNLGIVAVLWLGGNMVHNSSLEIGKIVSFINYLIQITSSLIMVVMLVINFSRAQASAERINEVFHTETTVKDPEKGSILNGSSIEFCNVSFRYSNTGENVLNHLNFQIGSGEKIGIIGSTGSGKSTLVSLIPRLYDVTEGQILVGGTPVQSLNLKELRESIGMVMQESILFSGTVEDNLKFGSRTATDQQMREAASDAMADGFIREKELQFQSIIGQRGRNFSGGQKQRLSIARTLIRRPEILILDDASSALDVETESKLHERIRSSMSESTILVVAQRISAVMELDRILVLEQGEAVAFGTHSELLKTSEIYRSIAVSQLGEEVLACG